VDDLGKMVDDIDIAGLEKTVTDLPSDSLYQTIVPILYWVIVGLASVISAIVVFNLLGLLCGLVLRPSHVTDGERPYRGYHFYIRIRYYRNVYHLENIG